MVSSGENLYFWFLRVQTIIREVPAGFRRRSGGVRVDLEFGGDPSSFGLVMSFSADDVIDDVIIVSSVDGLDFAWDLGFQIRSSRTLPILICDLSNLA